VGTSPVGIAVTPDGTKAYVTNANSSSVSVIATATNTVVGSPIPVGNLPQGITVTPDGTKVYVANRNDNTVSVIATATNTVVGSPIPIPVLPSGFAPQPFGVAVTPDGTKVYVVNTGPGFVAGTVSVIATATNTVVGSPIPVGTAPNGEAVTPDGSKVYVANYSDSNVSVIDTATNTVVGSPIPVAGFSVGVAVTPDGTKVYVVNRNSNNVSVIATATNTVVGSPIPVGNFPLFVVISPSTAALQVSPATDIAASGVQGQLPSPSSFNYQLSSTNGSVHYLISGIPSWLNASFTTGTIPPTVTDTFSVNACGFGPGTYSAIITFANTGGGQGNTTRNTTLAVNPGTNDDCKDGGWQKFTCAPGPFKNQGQCVSYFARK
jgi:YVTN family beta-propeller protein